MSGLPPAVDAALLAAWLAVLVATVVRYRRGSLSERRLFLLGGAALAWIAYSTLQVTETALVGDRLEYALAGTALVLLVGGLYGLYRGWKLGGRREAVALSR